LLGENNPVLIIMYFFDFAISFIMLRLFNIYADKSCTDEGKLKKLYLMSLQSNDGIPEVLTDSEGRQTMHTKGCVGNGLVALAKKLHRDDLET